MGPLKLGPGENLGGLKSGGGGRGGRGGVYRQAGCGGSPRPGPGRATLPPPTRLAGRKGGRDPDGQDLRAYLLREPRAGGCGQEEVGRSW